MLSEDFGDLTPVEEDLADCEEVLRKIAVKTVGSSGDPRFADVLQEGRIQFWKSYSELPDDENRVRYSVHRAKLRMRHVGWRDEGMTGHTRMPGRPEVKTVAVLDKPVETDGSLTVRDIMDAGTSIDGVEIAYHYGQIMQALNEMTPQNREYVYLRFWGGWTDTEIAKHFGLSTSGLNNRWARTIRPSLVQALSHLQPV